MAEISQLQVETALKEVIDPYLEKDLVSAKSVKNIAVASGKVSVDVVLGYPAKGSKEALAAKLKDKVAGIPGGKAVASGKGGVGKSTVAVNLALALSAEGANVGILDADIYGPSQPSMLGVKMKPESKDGKTLEPTMSYHLQSMSIGYLIDEETPMIWRGPMVTQALEQLLRDTNWTDIDYMIVDLPPGTGA